MGNEKVLRERRKAELDKADGIVALCETEQRGMTADEKKDFDAHMAEVKRLEEEIEASARAKAAKDELEARKRYDVPEAARQVPEAEGDPQKPAAAQVSVGDVGQRGYQKGDALAAITAARIKFAGYEQQRAINWARQTWGESSPQCRALTQSSFTAGGALIPENFVGAEFIELLKAQAAVRRAGARSVTLVNGSFTTPKLTAGVTGYWSTSEGANITPSEPTFGQLKLVEKKYTVLVPFSNDLRRNQSLDAVAVVRDDMVRTAANDEDVVFLNGDGTAGKPKGIYYWTGSTQKANTAGTALANVRTDIRKAKNGLDSSNAPYVRRAWFMHSRSMNYMGWDLVDGNSNFAFPSLQNAAGATLGGDPVYRDNNISITLSSNQSQIFYVEMSECFIGDSMELEIEVFENATYADSSGVLRSGISRDESCVRLIRKTDFGMRHPESAFVIEQVTYGA